MGRRRCRTRKLPDRRALIIFNSFDIARFRGVPKEWEEEEKKTSDAARKKNEVQKVARESGANVVDLDFIQSALDDQV